MDVIKQHFGVWALEILYYGQIFVSGACSKKCISPKGWQNTPPNKGNPKMFVGIDYIMVLHISTCNFDVKNISDAFSHVPDPF